jgi:hypothetical protein
MDRTPAARNWRTKLPVVGSVYIASLSSALTCVCEQRAQLYDFESGKK